jgi:transcriptional regulator with XRE-family HTH domain
LDEWLILALMTGDELQRKRKRMGLSQGQLADELGVDLGTVSRWEREARTIPPFLHLALEALAARRKAAKAKKASQSKIRTK